MQAIQFDKYRYGSSVNGDVIYPTVTISGGPSGTIMNGDGWSNLQTSGANLYGSTDSKISFDFNQAVSSFSLDVINGIQGHTDTFTVQLHGFGGAALSFSSESVMGTLLLEQLVTSHFSIAASSKPK